MQLLEHNKKTLQEVEEYAKKGSSCCVVNACGSGKTSIMAAFLKNHPENSFLILTKQKNAKKYYEQCDDVFKGDNVCIVTYSKMCVDVKTGNFSSYNADFYLVDEAHYVGALSWGAAFNTLTDMFKPLLIGLTATPQRFKDQGTDRTIVTTHFAENIAGGYSTTELEKRGVFTEPEYIPTIYNMEQLIEEQLERLSESDLDDKRKEQLSSKLFDTLLEWEEKGEPSAVIQKHLPDYMYKEHCNRILVYVESIEMLHEKRALVEKWIHDTFLDKTLQSYEYTYMNEESEFANFLEEDNTDIKVLFSIDKIMETVHIDDLRVTIMLRPSVSNRIITQQFGRINNITNKNKPLIVDMVNNLSQLDAINHNIKGLKGRDHAENDDEKTLNIHIPHLKRASHVFSEIDRALCRFKPYTYKGFTGSLHDICEIHSKRLSDVKKILKFHTLDETMEIAHTRHYKVDQSVIDESIFLPDCAPTEEQEKYVEDHLELYIRYLDRKSIEDDDIRQNLFFLFRSSIVEYWHLKDAPHVFNHRIVQSLHRGYIRALRTKTRHLAHVINNNHLDGLKIHEESLAACHNHWNEITKELLQGHLAQLTSREQAVLISRFGLEDGEPKLLEDVGKIFGVSRERIRQIEAKAIRKLKHPSRIGGLDCGTILEELDNSKPEVKIF